MIAELAKERNSTKVSVVGAQYLEQWSCRTVLGPLCWKASTIILVVIVLCAPFVPGEGGLKLEGEGKDAEDDEEAKNQPGGPW